MKRQNEFLKLVDNNFFKHITKKSLFARGDIPKRKDFLISTYEKLLKNITEYRPQKPKKISTPKNKYTIRMTISFELGDYCVYYYCIKVIEKFIAKNKVKGTFGGFSLGGKLRKKERDELKGINFELSFQDSYNPNSFNIYKWIDAYGEYMTLIKDNASKLDKDYFFAVYFDIANFYDCIRLDKLKEKIEKEIKEQSKNGDEKFDDEIRLLFNFLKYWNKDLDPKKNIGIPQEEVGDCSRILANFFLQDYDNFIFNLCDTKTAKYLRYCDDMIIFTKSKKDAKEIMYKASEKLYEEGLNINNEKIKEFKNYQEFKDYYSFDIFKELESEKKNVNKAFELFLSKKNSGLEFKESSVLKRLLNKKINISGLTNLNRIKFLSYIWDESFLIYSNDYYLNQIFNMLKNDSEKKEFIETLKSIQENNQFQSLKIYYEKFIKKHPPNLAKPLA